MFDWMTDWQKPLAVTAIIVAVICITDRRSLFWIFAAAMSFVISTAYARMAWPYPPALTAFCDAAVCLLLYRFWQERWEMFLFLLFQASVLISIAYLAGLIGPHSAYVTALEVVNWIALALIGGTRIVSLIRNAVHVDWWPVRLVRGADRALHAHARSAFR